MGCGTVLRDLAQIGFNAEWVCLRASDVGAPHRRERWFCLGYSDKSGLEGWGEYNGASQRVVGASGHALAELASGKLLSKVGGTLERNGVAKNGGLGNPNGITSQRFRRPGTLASAPRLPRGKNGRDGDPRRGASHNPSERMFPPPPGSREWEDIAPDAQPAIRRMADGSAHRNDRIRCLGNSVVPLQAALALKLLIRRITHE